MQSRKGIEFYPPQGPKYTGLETEPHIFQHLSLDLLGPLNFLPFPGSKKPVKMYILAVADKNYGAFETQIIDGASTKAILMGLLNIQNRFNKIKSISTDAGTAFINLNPEVISSQAPQIKHLFEGVEFFCAKPNSQWQSYVERHIQTFKKMIRTMLKVSKNTSWPLLTVFEGQLLFSYITNLMNNVPFSTDLENNLLCPNSFIKMSNLDPNGPPEINSKFKTINRMADIINKNYQIAKKVRDQQIVNSLHNYKNINHRTGNVISTPLLPHQGQPIYVDYKGKYNSLQFGTIIEVIGSGLVRVKFQDGSIAEIPSRLAHPLMIPELGGCFANKPFPPLPNGTENQASQDIVNLI